MDSPEFPTSAGGAAAGNKPSPPRRELQLQGPRPTPLKIRKDSHKIKKPPIHPVQPQQQQQQQLAHHQAAVQQELQQRAPVIIYTVSPKVIHTNVDDFMTLVQRLTGSSSSSSSSSIPCSSTTTSAYNFDSASGGGGGGDGGAVSPAARFASIEKANSIQGEHRYSSPSSKKNEGDEYELRSIQGLENCGAVERITSSFPGILSPVPSSLPPISPNFFSPMMMSTMTMDPNNNNNQINSSSFFQDFSPIFNGSSFLSPSTNFLLNSSSSATPIPSPTPPFDLFNNYFSDF